jgi:hypothetical protein
VTEQHRMTPVPSDRYEAANWLALRHERVRYLAARLGAVDDHASADAAEGEPGIDPDVIAQAVYDHEQWQVAWDDYSRRYRPPSRGLYRDEDEWERAYEAWEQSGPPQSAGAAAFGPMSSGEKTQIRLLALLGRPRAEGDAYDSPERRVGWSIRDVSSMDEAGAAIVADMLEIVRAQLPAWMYPGGPPPPASVQQMRDLRAQRRGEAP